MSAVRLQFPDPEIPLHRILTGLVMAAVALPSKVIISRMFEMSNRPAGLKRKFLKRIGLAKPLGPRSWCGSVGG